VEALSGCRVGFVSFVRCYSTPAVDFHDPGKVLVSVSNPWETPVHGGAPGRRGAISN
jgi:hypothetical protein